MKYENVNYAVNGKIRSIDVRGLSIEILESMTQEGQFLCPGKNCSAKLCLVHSSKNGGRTCFLKSVDDEMHAEKCEYKIENYKERQLTKRTDGVFTEKQVNDAVRRIYNDYTNPVEDTERVSKKNSNNSKQSTKTSEDGNDRTRIMATGGKIVYGEQNGEEVSGRMSRRYEVSSADVGIMTTICGVAKEVIINQHNELIVKFKDERLSNIEVILGAVYEHNNPSEHKNIYLVKEYFDSRSGLQDVTIAAGGLVNSYNGKLVLELQSNGSLRIDNLTIMKMAYNKAKENALKGD